MIIDSHTHLGAFPSVNSIAEQLTSREAIASWRTKHPQIYAAAQTEEPVDNSVELIEAMDRHGIDRSLVQQTPGVPFDSVYSWAASHPERLTALGSVTDWPRGRAQSSKNPADVEGPEPAAQRAQRAVRDLGVVGIGETRTSAITRNVDPVLIARDFDPLMDVLAERKTPIQMVTGWTQFPGNLMYQDPLWIDELASRHSSVPIVLTKMGRSIRRFFDSCLVVAMRNSNVYLDIVGTSPEHLKEAVENLGAERILFGTDWTYTWRHVASPADVHTRHLGLVAEVLPDEAAQSLVLGETACRLFGIGLSSG